MLVLRCCVYGIFVNVQLICVPNTGRILTVMILAKMELSLQSEHILALSMFLILFKLENVVKYKLKDIKLVLQLYVAMRIKSYRHPMMVIFLSRLSQRTLMLKGLLLIIR